MLNKNWKIKEKIKVDENVLQEANSKLVAQLLLQRGINTPQKIKNFFSHKKPQKMALQSQKMNYEKTKIKKN